MKLIIPMAGKGKRMRPHTLTVPKPLIKLAGKPVVQRIAESINMVCGEPLEEVGFVIHPDFGVEVEEKLMDIAKNLGAKGKIFYQEEPLGTAHAVYCAEAMLEGKTLIAFADTLFRASFKMDIKEDGIIWVKEVEDPSAFGVVKTNEKGYISEFIEKPSEPVSRLAIIGIYYFKDAALLKQEIKFLLDNNIKEKGEFQLTNALENLKNKGVLFKPATIDEWLDCGNKDITLQTHARVIQLALENNEKLRGNFKQKNSVIIEPCFLADGVVIENSIIGPHVSVEKNAVLKNTVISNSIVGEHALIENGIINWSMIGEHAVLKEKEKSYSLGAYSVCE
ncbi:MAG: sugar phosphate nucleotidyltransferase [Bacteroidia bacterium]|nr:sugar phosphate nucleotidyltransferase [Bacteroidia bacterium]